MNEETVRQLCAAAGLDIAEDRVALIAPQLAAWVEAANELSRKLAVAEHRGVQPIIVFRHPAGEGSEE